MRSRLQGLVHHAELDHAPCDLILPLPLHVLLGRTRRPQDFKTLFASAHSQVRRREIEKVLSDRALVQVGGLLVFGNRFRKAALYEPVEAKVLVKLLGLRGELDTFFKDLSRSRRDGLSPETVGAA